jgi:hypothetical protein
LKAVASGKWRVARNTGLASLNPLSLRERAGVGVVSLSASQFTPRT